VTGGPSIAGTSGAILAGGHSRRMGRDKARIPFGDRPLIAVVVDSLRPLFGELAVIAADAGVYMDLDVRVHADVYPGKGPLGGIYTALRESRAGRTFCVGCDMPFAAPALIAYLCQLAPDADVVVPRTVKGYEPLHAVYGKGCLPRLEGMLAEDHLRTDALFAGVRVHEVGEAELRERDPELLSLCNINTPADLADALRRVGSSCAS